MKNKYIHKLALGLVAVASTMFFNACSDWTEIEPVEIEHRNITEENPELYAQYLKSLRAYKKSDHKCMITTFDNSEKVPFNRAQHINVIPDSVDYVSLNHPNDLSEWELEEMAETRTQKGTQFVFTIDFDAIKLKHDLMVIDRQEVVDGLEEGEEVPAELPVFNTYLVDSLQASLALVKKYNYDGVIFSYKGKSIMHMSKAEKLEYTAYHNVFIGILNDWNSRNEDKLLIFSGYPQNLLDKTFLPACKYIIVPGTDAGSKFKLNYIIRSANVEGVPNDRFVVAVDMTSLDVADAKTGYWADGETRATKGVSEWLAAEHSEFVFAGMAIQNVSNDYFDDNRVYHNTRNAINTINPSIKN